MSRGAVRLVRRWFERLNPDASDERMALAFSLLAGGAVLSLLGVLVVVAGDLSLPGSYGARQLGFAAAAAGLPVFLTGIATALPSSWWERALVAAGLALTAGAVGLFTYLYPDQWHLTVRTPNGYAIGLYVAGSALVSAGTAGCLGTYLTERARGAARAGEGEDERRTYSDEEIRADLRWAEEQGWNWGGVRESSVDAELRLKEDVEPMQIKGNLGQELLEEHDSTEEAVTAARSLTNLRGVQPERTEPDTLEDQVGDLKALRRRKRDERREQRQSWGWRLRHPIRWLRGE
jgi:hypothetical protein